MEGLKRMEWEERLNMHFRRDERAEGPVLHLQCRDDVPFLTFPKLEACDDVEHLFSTRAGGVSTGQFSTMNFSVKLGDQRENVTENYRRVAGLMHGRVEDITGTVQTHTTNIRTVSEADRGKVAWISADYDNVDGLVTNTRGIILAAFTADCVPIYFVDPVKKAIGLAHSGWRGTVANMAGKMVERMQTAFGTDPKDLIAAIGPSICQSCYEVDETVAKAFREAIGEDEKDRTDILESGIYSMRGKEGLRQILEEGKESGKYQLDLWLTNLILLKRAGVKLENIDVTDLCTAHNADLLFSHRASCGKRGNMGAFLKLKDWERDEHDTDFGL